MSKDIDIMAFRYLFLLANESPGMNPMIVRKLLYPAYRFIKRDGILPKLRELERKQWLSTDELLALQWTKLKKLLSYAYESVPYYRSLFSDVGLRPDDINSAEDFARIPILTKEDIRKNMDRLTAPDFDRKKLIPNSTGGSTGENLKFYNDLSMNEYATADTLRCKRWLGVDIADKEVRLWGSRFDIRRSEVLSIRIKNNFMNDLYLSSYDLSVESMKRYVDKLVRYRPKLITGYASPLTVFANYLLENGMDRIRPQAIISSAETLFPHQREVIESAFGCKVFNRYGCREFGNIAHECPEHKGLHISVVRMYLEFLQARKPVAPGQLGEIFVTDLDNYGMPFIRYRIGDLGVPSDRKCRCGRGLSLMERAEGRVYDIVTTPSGKRVAGTYWSFISRAVEGIKQFQVIQKQRNGVAFSIVPDNRFKSESLEYLKAKIAEHCGEDFQVTFHIVDEIPLTGSGKFRFVISELQENPKGTKATPPIQER